MSNERCIPCEQHAELHKGNWGFGPQNEPCQQCEEHARMHSAEGCGGLLLLALITCGLSLLFRKRR
jgi:hypothetical protein